MRTAQSSIRDIVAIIDLYGEQRAAELAAEIARRTEAHLTGIALAVDPLVPIYATTAPIPTDFIVDAREQSLGDAEKAHDAFIAIGDRAGVPVEARIVESLSGDAFQSVVRNVILSDIAIVGQENPEKTEPLRAALIEALLFQAGLPTLLVPYSGPLALSTDRAVVAWNGSANAARAVRAALPLLALSKETLVVIVEERKAEGEPGADIGAYLARHGLNVTVRVVGGRTEGVGATILDFAAQENAGFLVMGAYGHSRIREFFLGGATRHVLADATLPVLLAH